MNQALTELMAWKEKGQDPEAQRTKIHKNSFCAAIFILTLSINLSVSFCCFFFLLL